MEPGDSVLHRFRRQEQQKKNGEEKKEEEVKVDEPLVQANEAPAAKEAPVYKQPEAAAPQVENRIAKRQDELRKEYPAGLKYQLAPFDSSVDDTGDHLVTEDVIGDDATKKKADFFICPICSMIALDPVECAKCDSIYCSGCITPWLSHEDFCPKKCDGTNAMNLKPVNRFVLNEMRSIQLKCHNEGCDFTGPLDEAVKHKKTCSEGF